MGQEGRYERWGRMNEVRALNKNSATREFVGLTTSVLVLIVDVTPHCGCGVRLVGSKDFFQMPVSPVCLDTLVLATVGAAVNLINMFSNECTLSEASSVGLVGMTTLTGLTLFDIEHPLLLS